MAKIPDAVGSEAPTYDDKPADSKDYKRAPEVTKPPPKDDKDDKRAPVATKPLPVNPDRNPDPKGDPFYTPPPPEPEVVNKTEEVKKAKKKAEKKKAEKPPYKGVPMKRKYKQMTLSKLTGDNDTWVENNDKYNYRNMKMHTSRMIQNKTYGGMYYVRMSIGSPPQI
jgi:hypothetical protein